MCFLAVYSGCGAQKTNDNLQSLSDFCSKPVNLPVAPLKPKAQTWQGPFVGQKIKVFSKAGSQIKAGTKYDIIIDRACAEEASEDKISKKVLKSAVEFQSQIKQLALGYVFDKDILLAEFESQINSDNCVIGVALPGKVQKAFLNDSQVSSQRHITQLNYEISYQTFFQSQYAVKNRVKFAVVDTGIDCSHPDLNCIKNFGASGFPDKVDNDNDPSDEDGHGTHVAGIAGAIVNNSLGGAGLAGNILDILPVRVIGPDGGEIADVFNGIQYAISSGVDVINMSFGAVGNHPTLEQAVISAVNAGIFVVMAAGNDSKKLGEAGYKYEPGYIGDEVHGAVTVGSVDFSGSLSFFSNFHPAKVEIAAYGNENSDTGIFSTWKGGLYQRESGTSQATPQVGAAAALLISFYKTHKIAYTMPSLEADILSSTNVDPELSSLVASGRVIDFARLSQVALSKAGKKTPEIQQIICQK